MHFEYFNKTLGRLRTLKVIRYISVGLLCALVYTVTLLALNQAMPLWLANPGAFLAGSLTGGLFHSKFTFRTETQGKPFAKRWVALQYLVNLGVCTLLPTALPTSLNQNIQLLIFVFTPTALNALIWSRAAAFSRHRLRQQHSAHKQIALERRKSNN